MIPTKTKARKTKPALTERRVQNLIAAAVAEALKAAPRYPDLLLGGAQEELASMPDKMLYRNQAELYRRLSWVVTAIELTAQTAATTPLNVYRRSGEDETDVPNHDFELLLNKPNPEDSRFEFLFGTMMFRKLAGNCYWWLNKANEFTPPDEIWIIQPHRIRPVPDDRMYLRGYIYDTGLGHEIALEPWEVVHFKRYNPFSHFVGLSAIEALAVVALGDIKMQEWNAKLFAENNARLPGILAFSDMLKDSDWTRLQKETRDKANKRELMMLRGVGKGGVDWMQAGVSPRDMEFLKGRSENKQEIYNVLAPGLSSMLDVNATEANSRTGETVFRNHTVWPLLEETAQKISLKIMPLYGEEYVARFEDIRVTDKQLELNEQDKYMTTHTIDETRSEYYGDDKIGDERGGLIPAQLKIATGVPGSPDGGNNTVVTGQPTAPVATPFQQDMLKFRRKALRSVGKAVEFESESIPLETILKIYAALPGCKSDADVKMLFAQHLVEAPRAGLSTEAIAALIQTIGLGVQALSDEA